MLYSGIFVVIQHVSFFSVMLSVIILCSASVGCVAGLLLFSVMLGVFLMCVYACVCMCHILSVMQNVSFLLKC
jgi:hypothetical protein